MDMRHIEIISCTKRHTDFIRMRVKESQFELICTQKKMTRDNFKNKKVILIILKYYSTNTSLKKYYKT